MDSVIELNERSQHPGSFKGDGYRCKNEIEIDNIREKKALFLMD